MAYNPGMPQGDMTMMHSDQMNGQHLSQHTAQNYPLLSSHLQAPAKQYQGSSGYQMMSPQHMQGHHSVPSSPFETHHNTIPSSPYQTGHHSVPSSPFETVHHVPSSTFEEQLSAGHNVQQNVFQYPEVPAYNRNRFQQQEQQNMQSPMTSPTLVHQMPSPMTSPGYSPQPNAQPKHFTFNVPVKEEVMSPSYHHTPHHTPVPSPGFHNQITPGSSHSMNSQPRFVFPQVNISQQQSEVMTNMQQQGDMSAQLSYQSADAASVYQEVMTQSQNAQIMDQSQDYHTGGTSGAETLITADQNPMVTYPGNDGQVAVFRDSGTSTPGSYRDSNTPCSTGQGAMPERALRFRHTSGDTMLSQINYETDVLQEGGFDVQVTVGMSSLDTSNLLGNAVPAPTDTSFGDLFSEDGNGNLIEAGQELSLSPQDFSSAGSSLFNAADAPDSLETGTDTEESQAGKTDYNWLQQC